MSRCYIADMSFGVHPCEHLPTDGKQRTLQSGKGYIVTGLLLGSSVGTFLAGLFVVCVLLTGLSTETGLSTGAERS